MFHPGCHFCGKEVAGRRLEELQNGMIPNLGDAGTASWPCSQSVATTFEPMSPVPPITTIFMGLPFLGREEAAEGNQDSAGER